jgi:hypothetical protein
LLRGKGKHDGAAPPQGRGRAFGSGSRKEDTEMRRSLAPALALLVLALVAAPAVAQKTEPPNPHNFIGSGNAAPRFAGETQEFNFKPFAITCEKAKSTTSGAAQTFPSKTLSAVVKYSDCEAEATLNRSEYELKAKFVTPVTLNYRANGVVEIGSGGTIAEGKLTGAGPIEIAVKGAFKCTIDVAAGTYPANSLKKPEAEYEAATFTPEEETVVKGKNSTVVKKLGISTALTKMPYEIEGEFCEALPKTEFTGGSYTGSLQAEIKKGDLSWE